MPVISDSFRDLNGNLLIDSSKNASSFSVTRNGETKNLEDWVFNQEDVNFDSDIIATGSMTPRSLPDRFAEKANPKDFGAVNSPLSLLEEYGDVVSARQAYPNIYIEDGNESVDWAAIQSAVNTGKYVVIPAGDYYINTEIEIVNAGQVIEFEGTGGYAYGEDIGADWQFNSETNARIIVGTGRTVPQRVRTRRLYRGSASDPQDTALSVGINIQAENVHLIRPCVWLRTSYEDGQDFGYFVHCGIFVGTRVGVQIHDPIVIGYFRRAGIYIDVSGHSGLPRFPARDGSTYPDGTVKNGADGTHLYNPYIRGPRIGLAVLGALPKEGAYEYSDPYYDEITGTTISDSRGSFGASDFLVVGGRIYGPDRASNRRVYNPITNASGQLSNGTLQQEPDDAPAAVYISGLAGNASRSIWGMRFIGTRIATFEAFRMRLKFAARINLYGSHIEGRNGGRFDTNGNSINTNDYTSTSYGDIAASSLPNHADSVRYVATARQTPTDGAFNHLYIDTVTLETDSGRYFRGADSYTAAISGELDLRSGEGSTVRLRNGDSTSATFSQSGCTIVGAGANTVGSTANAFLTSGGTLSRSTSARKYKTDIQPIDSEYIDKVMGLKSMSYRPSEITADPDKSKRFLGFIADDADEMGLTELVDYNEETGEVEGFAYSRMTVIHQSVLQDLLERIATLESKLQE